MLKKLHQNKKGFTLAELLIVVAIIGVLVAISIPIFTGQLEKAREATDEANIRALYAECASSALTETAASSKVTLNKDANGVTTASASYVLTQQKDGLEGGATSIDIGGVSVASSNFGPGKTINISVKSDGSAATIGAPVAGGGE